MKHLSKAMACDAFGENLDKWKGLTWRAQEDGLRTFLGDLVAVVPKIDFLAGWSL
jgi:hypothetical protein